MTVFKKYVFSSLLLAVAAIIGFLEGLVPVPFISHVPGVKPGFANIAFMLCYETIGKKYAFILCIARPVLVFMFSGNAVSFALSLCGGIFAFMGIYAFHVLYERKYISYVGLSSLSACFHITGQMVCASVLMKTKEILTLLPVSLLMSLVCGVVTGFIMNITLPKAKEIIKKRAYMNL